MRNLVRDNSFFSMVCTTLENEVKRLKDTYDEKIEECEVLRQLAEELKCITVTQTIEHNAMIKHLTDELESVKIGEKQ